MCYKKIVPKIQLRKLYSKNRVLKILENLWKISGTSNPGVTFSRSKMAILKHMG